MFVFYPKNTALEKTFFNIFENTRAYFSAIRPARVSTFQRVENIKKETKPRKAREIKAQK